MRDFVINKGGGRPNEARSMAARTSPILLSGVIDDFKERVQHPVSLKGLVVELD